jgi:hypothetical protein
VSCRRSRVGTARYRFVATNVSRSLARVSKIKFRWQFWWHLRLHFHATCCAFMLIVPCVTPCSLAMLAPFRRRAGAKDSAAFVWRNLSALRGTDPRGRRI